MSQTSRPAAALPSEPTAAQKVYRGIMEELEHHRLVTGQRLVETELAMRFAVGRNAVREAMQLLAARGVIDLQPNRSSVIRELDEQETYEILEVAEVLTILAVRAAARNFAHAPQAARLTEAMARLADPVLRDHPGQFSAARRAFYRALLDVAGNRELNRLFPAISMHIIYSQYQSPRLRDLRLADYAAMYQAISERDEPRAEAAARDHVDKVREAVRNLMAERAGAGSR